MGLRLLLGVCALLAGVLAWFWFAAPERGAVVAAPAIAAQPDTNDAPVEVDAVARPSRGVVETQPLAGDRGAPAAAPEVLEERVGASATGDETVRARVTVVAARAVSFSGEVVTAQSWLADGDRVHEHEATLGPDGVAEFTFPGAVHIDWFRFAPRPETGLALTVGQFHVDLAEGDLFETTLAVVPAGGVTGEVVTLDGAPVEGVPVLAYFESDGVKQDGQALADWYPPHTRTTTGPDGRFAFASLAPGDWSVAVPPDTWLQVRHPVVEDFVWAEVEPAVIRDVGTLVVTPLQRFRLTVLDAAGAPAERAAVSMKPIRFASDRLALPDESAPSAFQRWVAGDVDPGPERVPWEADELTFETRRDGSVECRTVAGTWELLVRARDQEDQDALSLVLEVPCSDRTIALPSAVTAIAGVVADRAGHPIADATVEVRRGKRREQGSTDAHGEFELRGLTPGPLAELRIDHPQYLERSFAIEPGSGRRDVLPRYELDESASIRVRLVSTSGPLPDGLSIGLTSGLRPRVPADRVAAMEAWYGASQERYRQRYTRRRASGEMRIDDLFPGEYHVSLFLGSKSKLRLLRDFKTPPQELAGWTLATGPEVHEIEVDASAWVVDESLALARFRGSVRDGVTGDPVPGAVVVVQNGQRSVGTSTDPEGRFTLDAEPGTLIRRVLCEGFLPWYGEPLDYGPGEQTLDVALDPGGIELALRFVGKRGGELPDVQVLLHDPQRPEIFVLVTDPDGDRNWRNTVDAPGGRLRLGGLRPGALVCRVLAEGFLLGEVTVDVVPSADVQELDVPLELTVEELRTRAAAWFED